MRKISNDTRLYKVNPTSDTMAITAILKVNRMSIERKKNVGMYGVLQYRE